MATDEERLLVRIEAQLRTFEKAMAKATGTSNRTASSIERRFTAMESRLSAVGAGLARSLLAPLAALASAREIGQAADAFTRIQNALKVVGLQGEAAAAVFDRLFQAAQRNAAPVESLVELYSRASLVQKELGVTTEDLLHFTEGVAAALRVSGKSAAESSGALLQLSQALGSGVVRAEEFNSILEGALPIAQAAARGLEEAGGSVAKLRTLVIDGKVSSEAFFKAFEAGQGTLESLAASADTTLGQAFTRFQNQLIAAVGRLNDTFGASHALTGELDNLGRIVERLTNFIIRNAQAVADVQSEYQSWLNAINGAAEALGRLTGASALGPALGLSDENSLRISRAAEDAAAMQRDLALAAALADKARGAGEATPSVSAPAANPVSLSNFKAPASTSKGKTPGQKFDDDIKRIQARTASLQAETAAVGESTFAYEKAIATQNLINEAKQAGLKITPALTAQIDEEASAYARATVELERANEQQQRLNELAQFTGDALTQAFHDMVPAIETGNKALDGLIQKLIDATLQAAIFGSGPFGNLFGNAATGGRAGGIIGAFFGGRRAAGGPVVPGRAYLVGENGPEPFVPSTPGRILPTRSIGGASVSVRIQNSYTNVDPSMRSYIDAQTRASEARMVAAIEPQIRKLAHTKPGTFR